jgi:ribosomal protein S18 acetylase RimI-like enzyme
MTLQTWTASPAAALGILTRDTAPRKARRSELPPTAANLTAAFAADPVFAYVFPDPVRRPGAIAAFFDLVVQTLWVYDEIYTIDHAGGAVWVPPGEPAVPELAARAFEEKLAAIDGLDLAHFAALAKAQERNHPAAPHAYLWFVGVHPDHQGLGHGRALMATVLRRCDLERMPAYLEATTATSRDRYQRLGFEVTAELRLPDGPTMWGMWRQPA